MNRPKRGQRIPTVRLMPCKIYSRIVGYYAALERWHEGKKREFKDRQEYSLHKMGITQ